MRSTRGCATFRVIFSRKNSEKGVNFSEKFRKGLQCLGEMPDGLVILMTQMTIQKKTELLDDFDLVWTKTPQF